MDPRVAALEAQLNDFDPVLRADALSELLALVEQGLIPLPPFAEVANMHCHTFFSFNAYGYSPTALAWLARRRGFKLMGTVEFDVLDSVDEFLEACTATGVRASTGIESRLFLPEFITREINSPGEPGVYYHMGIGFTTSTPAEPAASILADMRRLAARRNVDVLARVNDYLAPVAIDYERDVLPLTPSGSATERHMVVAYIKAAERTVLDPAGFWASKLGLSVSHARQLMDDDPEFQNQIRRHLMKRGGVGYVQPMPATFPSLEQFHEMVESSDALICATWLDGLSEGEQAIEELLGLLIDKGAVALNIVPDRNWNVADPELRRVKVQDLYDIVELADDLALPLNVGTEMNSYGQKLIDDFEAPELSPVREAFMDGAYFAYGHTIMQRTLGLGYHSDWAQRHLPSRRSRNDFYARMGRLVEPDVDGLELLRRQNATMSPEEIVRNYQQGMQKS